MNTKFDPKDFIQNDFLFGSNAVFIEELYQLYLTDPDLVDQSWRIYFENLNEVGAKSKLKTTAKIIGQFEDSASAKNKNTLDKNSKQGSANEQKSVATSASDAKNTLKLRAKMIIEAYRNRGHYLAKLDPLALEKLQTKTALKLNIEDFGFTSAELENLVAIEGAFDNSDKTSLSHLVDLLDKTYANHIGVQFEQVENLEEKAWLYSQIENSINIKDFAVELRQDILKDLVELEGFEQYLQNKFPGAKRFSIEGSESSLIALINFIKAAGDSDYNEVIVGMAHRGRLCTLTKVMGKPYRALFAEFQGASPFPEELGVAGDVKYHMGYSNDIVSPKGNKVHLSLCANPSHLEAVNPVVAGKTRAKQDLNKDKLRQKTLSILLHGDAAFCGQGVVAECLVMSGLDAYNVGGTIHIITNNQIGFTANSNQASNSRYCTDIAKIIGAPILHVNGEDVEAVISAARIALEYKIKFNKDVILDVVGYRKYGHNEGDEPMYTQAAMYNVIKHKISPANLYANMLIEKNVISADYVEKLKTDFKNYLDIEYKEATNFRAKPQWLQGLWTGYSKNIDNQDIQTGADRNKLVELGLKLCNIPANFNINPKLNKLFELRAKSLQDGILDWATAEQLAFASLLEENIAIRLTGQDCERGTFSHRHSILHDQLTEQTYIPLNNLSNKQAEYYVANSNLSEYGVLGFEYGYSLVHPKQLVLWEAQFGDFCNGAQIMFDQFIASAETKWLQLSGLVVLLPHASEGAGPEHSSARLERFLQLASEDNMQIVYPTTPASIFHLLRKQIQQNTRKPLIVMTPKSLLRHKLATSHIQEFDAGTSFKPVIDETDGSIEASKVSKVIFCAGKIYYDLLEMRNSQNIKDVTIVRFEQLYPFREDLADNLIKKYNKAKKFIWCQEEPENMGAWHFMQQRLNKILMGNALEYVGPQQAASPAMGSLYQHNKQHQGVIKAAFEIK